MKRKNGSLPIVQVYLVLLIMMSLFRQSKCTLRTFETERGMTIFFLSFFFSGLYLGGYDRTSWAFIGKLASCQSQNGE